PGIYRLINLQSHTALDLSEGDGKSFIGWTQHTNANQRFVFTPLGHGGGYLIQSAWNGNYATVQDGICTGVSVVGTGFPATWALEKVEKGDTFFRIRWPNSHYVMDLEGYGSDQDGTRVSLASRVSRYDSDL
ncbi:ricin B lectin domain-containing protein, partial [Lentinula raphanica]